MKIPKTLRCLALAAAAGLLVSNAVAQQVTVSQIPGYFVDAGEFNVTPIVGTGYSAGALVGGGFQSFCISRNAGITLPGTYFATVSAAGIYLPDNLTITKGTAWLYSQFTSGTLAGYRYAGSAIIDSGFTHSERAEDAYQLQLAFWTLEGSYWYGPGPGPLSLTQDLAANPWLAKVAVAFGGGTSGLLTAMGANTPGDYNVGVLNLNKINPDKSVGAVVQPVLVLNPPSPRLSLTCRGGNGQVGQPFTSQLIVNGGTPPYIYSISAGSLPPGVTLDANTGVISGTPTAPGGFSFTGMVTDKNGLKATSTCTSGCSPSPCTTTWDFSTPSGCLGTSQTYTSGGLTIAAYGYDSHGSGVKLYGKTGGGDENGLGLCGEKDNEITVKHFIVLDLIDLINKGANNARMWIGSAQPGELYDIYGSKDGITWTPLLTAGTLDFTFFPIPSYPANRYIAVTANGSVNCYANVLLGAVSADCVGACSITIVPAPCKGSICGNVLKDKKCDGKLDGDPCIAGVTVTLKDASGKVVATTTTDSKGNYCFSDLAKGTYTVVITPPANCRQTKGCTTYSWKANDGRDCWSDWDNVLHWREKDGTHCWLGKDSNVHWKDQDGNCHSRGKDGKTKDDNDTDETCKDSDGRNSERQVCLKACENKVLDSFGFCKSNGNDNNGNNGQGDD